MEQEHSGIAVPYILEDRLGEMMLAIYEEAERVKQARLAREEAERQPGAGAKA